MLAKGTATNSSTPIPAPDDTPAFNELFSRDRRSLVAQVLATGSVERDVNELRLLRAFVSAHNLPQNSPHLTKIDLKLYFSAELARRTAHTVKCGYIIIHAFFVWPLKEEEIVASPMAHIQQRTPAAPLLDEVAIGAILKECAGNGVKEPSDMAIIRVLLDTGMCRAELAALVASNIDLDQQTIRIQNGKGDKPRTVFLRAKAIKTLDRYKRARPTYPYAALPQFWLSERGTLSAKSIYKLRSNAHSRRASRMSTHTFSAAFGRIIG